MEPNKLTTSPSVELIRARIHTQDLSKTELSQCLNVLFGDKADHYFEMITKEAISIAA